MGTRHCVQVPRDEDEGSISLSDSYDNDSTSNPIKKMKDTLSMESKMNSTDFECDPKSSFRSNIKRICRRKRLPFFTEIHKYNFYIWSSNKYGFGHDSIVIGSASRDEMDTFGYITAELCVDIDEKTVFPNTRYLNQYEGNQYIQSNKWKYQYSYTTSLKHIVDLVLNLIIHHGQYSNLHNGCHHFVEAFLLKIIHSEREYRIQTILKNDKLFKNTKNEYIRGIQRYRAHNKVNKQLKKQNMTLKYDTMESTLQFVGTMLVVPVVAMAISKETVKTKRDNVTFKCIDSNNNDHHE